MFGQQTKSKEASRVRQAIDAAKLTGKITIAAANGLLPASANVPQLTAHSTVDAVPIEVTQPDVGTAVMQVRNADGTPGPVTEVMGELPPPNEAVLTISGTSPDQQYTAERPSADQ